MTVSTAASTSSAFYLEETHAADREYLQNYCIADGSEAKSTTNENAEPLRREETQAKAKERIPRRVRYRRVLGAFWKRTVVASVKQVLLPVGYPESVCPEYVAFQFWDTMQEGCGYFRGILSSQAWMLTLGVGRPETSVVSAVVLTMILDYGNMLFGLLFGASASVVAVLVSDQKFWYLASACLGAVSTFLKIGAVSVPHDGGLRIYVLILATIMDAGNSVISNCCRAPLVAHLARNQNFADCAAKEGNQSRTLKLVAIGLGYRFLIFVNRVPGATMAFFSILSVGRLVCQYRAMRTLRLRTLNPERLELCLEAIFGSRGVGDAEEGLPREKAALAKAIAERACGAATTEEITPGAVSEAENILAPRGTLVRMGVSLREATRTEGARRALFSELEARGGSGRDPRHVLLAGDPAGDPGFGAGAILLEERAAPRDVFLAYYHAWLLERLSQGPGGRRRGGRRRGALGRDGLGSDGAPDRAGRSAAMDAAREVASETGDHVWECLRRADWDTQKLLLPQEPWRINTPPQAERMRASKKDD